MGPKRLVLITVTAACVGAANAQEDEPDLSFLEYLGSWPESDEEWLLIAEIEEEIDSEDEASVEDEETDETDDT